MSFLTGPDTLKKFHTAGAVSDEELFIMCDCLIKLWWTKKGHKAIYKLFI